MCAASLQASDDKTLTVYRSRSRSGVGPDFADKAEKELAAGDFRNAQRDIETAIRNDPTYWPSFYTRAKISEHDGKWALVIQDCNELLRQDSTFIPAALLRSSANVQLGNYAAASKELDNLIVLQPRPYYYAEALAARAWLRATCPNASLRNPQGAINDAKKACTITQWKEANSIDTLAVAYAASGDFNSAVKYVQQAMSAYDAGEMSKTLHEHAARFNARRPIGPK